MLSTLATTVWAALALPCSEIVAELLLWALATALLRLVRRKREAAPPRRRKTLEDRSRSAQKSQSVFAELEGRASSDYDDGNDDDSASTSAGSSNALESDTDGENTCDSSSCSRSEKAPDFCRISATMLLSLRPKVGSSPPDGLRAVGGVLPLATANSGAAAHKQRTSVALVGLRGDAPKKSGSQIASAGADRWAALRCDVSSKQTGLAGSVVEDRWEALRPRGHQQAGSRVDGSAAYASSTSTVARPSPASMPALDALLAQRRVMDELFAQRRVSGCKRTSDLLEAKDSSQAAGSSDLAQDDAQPVGRTNLDAAPWRQWRGTPPARVLAPGTLSGAAASLRGLRPMRHL